VVSPNIPPQELKLVIQGGLPKLPGTSTIMPFEDKSPPLTPAGEPIEVGSCTVGAAE
jgi:hypothetical protein